MDLISLFSGCGGLDRGFENAGFNVVWANDNDKNILDTYKFNHPNTEIEIGDVSKIPSSDIPNNISGLIGGPPCQSWSAAGNGKGINDPRGKLFFEYIRILEDKKPLFFLAENVKGMLSEKHKESVELIKSLLDNAGYDVTINLVNSADYGVPQKRERVIIVGYRKDLNLRFSPPAKNKKQTLVKEYLKDITVKPISSKDNLAQPQKCVIPNHEYFTGTYSYIFMSRNRVLDWNLPSYTIQASGRQASLHPQAPKMVKVEKDVMKFAHGSTKLYRRLSIRECARIQTFPDDFLFFYENLNTGYKMIGNAVPVNLAEALAKKIYSDLSNHLNNIKKESKSKSEVLSLEEKILCKIEAQTAS
ncbi:DNA cytosine methyltransferase [Winogradskyella immobilis]|uniref:DNA cytosine methyltransferase n=1 Tax=Winogradskyella immobilis TaxID=2816852 RepID=UPI001D0C465A|nr:DNA cytosine methyltransferase [Winogradskyella immobilis]MCG0017734.1 DNA cytosine methyltransferase [Winogradskyella immobilis]